jgi:hypothetical protein
MKPIKRVLLPALAVAALAAAGCGGDDNDFVADYNAAVAPLQRLTSDIAGGAGLATGPGAQRSLVRMADGFEAVEGRLRLLEPPGDVREELDGMIAALDASGEQVRTMADAAETGNLDLLTAEAQAFSTQGAALVRAETALRTAIGG